MRFLAARWFTQIGYLLIALICSGCASVALSASAPSGANSAPPAQLEPERVGEIALNALAAWNAGDYAGWSRDWSRTLKSGVPAGDFERFRERYFDRYGTCFAITHSESGPRSVRKKSPDRGTARVARHRDLR